MLILVYYQVSLLWSHTTHNITHVHFLGGDTGHTHTHTHTHSEEVAVKCILCIYPILGCPSSRAARSSGEPLWRPGTKSSDHVCLGQGQTGEWSVLWHVFSVGVLSGGKPLWTRGEHANSTQNGPGDSPPEHWRSPQYQQRPMRESNPGLSWCEAAVQAPEPP